MGCQQHMLRLRVFLCIAMVTERVFTTHSLCPVIPPPQITPDIQNKTGLHSMPTLFSYTPAYTTPPNAMAPGQSSASAATAMRERNQLVWLADHSSLSHSHTPAPMPLHSHNPSLSRSQMPTSHPYTPMPPPVPFMPSLPIKYSNSAPASFKLDEQ